MKRKKNEPTSCAATSGATRCERCGFVAEGIRCPRCFALKVKGCDGSCSGCGGMAESRPA